MSGQQWHPMPCDLIADFTTHQWTTANQAPKGVGYLWTWRQMEDGHAPSIRDLARYAGWTRWKAQQVRARVLDDRKTWEAFGSLTKLNRTAAGQPPDSYRTVETDKAEVIEAPPDSNQTATRQPPDTHARDPSKGKLLKATDHEVELPGKPHTESRQNNDNQHPENLEQGESDGRGGQQDAGNHSNGSGTSLGGDHSAAESPGKGHAARNVGDGPQGASSEAGDQRGAAGGSAPRGGAVGGAGDGAGPDHVTRLCDLYREHSPKVTPNGGPGRLRDSAGLREGWAAAVAVAEHHGHDADTLLGMFEYVFLADRGAYWRRGGKGHEIASGSALVTYLLRCKGTTYGTGEKTADKLARRLNEASDWMEAGPAAAPAAAAPAAAPGSAAVEEAAMADMWVTLVQGAKAGAIELGDAPPRVVAVVAALGGPATFLGELRSTKPENLKWPRKRFSEAWAATPKPSPILSLVEKVTP